MNNNTLHLCNYPDTKHWSQQFKFVQPGDAVIIYSHTLSPKAYEHIKDINSEKNDLYFVVLKNTDNIPTITNEYWVELVAGYKRTFTWK